MKIYSGTGVTETNELQINKGIGAIVLATTKEFADLTTESITIFVEKEGKNVDIARDIPIKDFMLLASYGEDSIHAIDTLKATAMCELTEDGGYIDLRENETIKFRLRNLDATKTYEIHGIEEPMPSKEVLKYEQKTMASETPVQDFDVKGYDLLVFTRNSSLSEINLTYDNGAVVKYTPFELEALERSLDNIQVIKSDQTLAFVTDRFQLPLKGIVNVQLRKDLLSRLDLFMRIDESDYELYNHQ